MVYYRHPFSSTRSLPPSRAAENRAGQCHFRTNSAWRQMKALIRSSPPFFSVAFLSPLRSEYISSAGMGPHLITAFHLYGFRFKSPSVSSADGSRSPSFFPCRISLSCSSRLRSGHGLITERRQFLKPHPLLFPCAHVFQTQDQLLSPSQSCKYVQKASLLSLLAPAEAWSWVLCDTCPALKG